MHGRSRVSEGSPRFRTSAACTTVMNALQRNAMPAAAFFGERPVHHFRRLARPGEHIVGPSCAPRFGAETAMAAASSGPQRQPAVFSYRPPESTFCAYFTMPPVFVAV